MDISRKKGILIFMLFFKINVRLSPDFIKQENG